VSNKTLRRFINSLGSYSDKNFVYIRTKVVCVSGQIFVHIRTNLRAYSDKFARIFGQKFRANSGKSFVHMRTKVSCIFGQKLSAFSDKSFVHIRTKVVAPLIRSVAFIAAACVLQLKFFFTSMLFLLCSSWARISSAYLRKNLEF
jgi:hypothetical protein